jgi:hypothetical protein
MEAVLNEKGKLREFPESLSAQSRIFQCNKFVRYALGIFAWHDRSKWS